MWSNPSRVRLVGAWLAAAAVIFACAVVAGAAITVGAGELWLVACLMPPAVMLLVWRDAPALSAAGLLRAADNRAAVRRPLEGSGEGA